MIHILTDSTADLSPELLQRCHINVIPLSVFLDGRTYQDGVDVTLEELFQLVEETGQLPKTSAPSVADFIQFFSRQSESIYISISSKLSATHQNAVLAGQTLLGRTAHVIDGLNLSTGTGLLVLKAAELRDQGWPAAEIVAEIQASVPRVRTSFVIDTMDYLYMGGRCSAMQSIVGSLLQIRPVIEVRQDGTLGVKDKIRGSRKKALQSMLADFHSHLEQIDLHRVFVTHSGCIQDAAYLVEELRKMANIEEVCITTAGSVIASHCGPNTIGLLYLLKG